MAGISPGLSLSTTGPDVQWVPGKFLYCLTIGHVLSVDLF